MFTEQIEGLKTRILTGTTTISDIDILNELEEIYAEACEKLEMFMNKSLDEPETLEARESETGHIYIENMTVYYEKQN